MSVVVFTKLVQSVSWLLDVSVSAAGEEEGTAASDGKPVPVHWLDQEHVDTSLPW